MKKRLSALLVFLLSLGLPACAGSQNPVDAASGASSAGQAETSSPAAASQAQETPVTGALRISVQCGDGVVLYELNDGSAAASLYAQLPLTLEVEDYSTNEKIFYPPQELDTSDAPLADAGAGTLAYYAPWGDVVMFYGDYSQNPSLFALGQVVSGGALVSGMSGTITIDRGQ